MDTIEQMIDVAQGLQDKGQIEEALQAFSKAFDLMIDVAGNHALQQHSDITDGATLRTMKPTIIAQSKEYLRRDITAAYVLNAMGVLFAQLNDAGNAQQKFIEAIEYIPSGHEFNDPADNLEQLANAIAALEAETEEEL